MQVRGRRHAARGGVAPSPDVPEDVTAPPEREEPSGADRQARPRRRRTRSIEPSCGSRPISMPPSGVCSVMSSGESPDARVRTLIGTRVV